MHWQRATIPLTETRGAAVPNFLIKLMFSSVVRQDGGTSTPHPALAPAKWPTRRISATPLSTTSNRYTVPLPDLPINIPRNHTRTMYHFPTPRSPSIVLQYSALKKHPSDLTDLARFCWPIRTLHSGGVGRERGRGQVERKQPAKEECNATSMKGTANEGSTE